MEYYKLNLNGCVYWQSDVKEKQKIYVKKSFSMSENLGIDRIFLKRISDTEYEEIITGSVLKFDDEKCISLKGADIPLSNITPITKSEVTFACLKIKHKEKIQKKYFQILDDLFKYNNMYQEKQERLLSSSNSRYQRK